MTSELGAVVLLWNPHKYAWEGLADTVERLMMGESVVFDWTTGRRKMIPTGTLVLFRKVGHPPIGIFGYGYTTGAVQQNTPRQRKRDYSTEFFVDIKLTDLIDPDVTPLLPASRLKQQGDIKRAFSSQANGCSISHKAANQILTAWHKLGSSGNSGAR
jgi:hypothetical protein